MKEPADKCVSLSAGHFLIFVPSCPRIRPNCGAETEFKRRTRRRRWRLREFLRFNYVTMTELTRRLGVTDGTLYSWLKGEFRPENPRKIIAFLGHSFSAPFGLFDVADQHDLCRRRHGRIQSNGITRFACSFGEWFDGAVCESGRRVGPLSGDPPPA